MSRSGYASAAGRIALSRPSRAAALLVVLVTVGLAACGAVEHLEHAQTAVVRVNGAPISAAVFERQLHSEMQLRAGQSAEDPVDLEARLRTEVLEGLIDAELIDSELGRRGLGISEHAVLVEMARWRAKFRAPSEFEAYVGHRYGGILAFRAELRRSLARARLMETTCPPPPIDDSRVRSYYDEHRAEFSTDLAVPRAPIVRSFEDAAAEIRESLARRAQHAVWRTVLQRLRDGAQIERLAPAGQSVQS